ncbi:hypothetical protein F511_01072 [Dorcoceras hygrometricum]|uniref:Uncharacterized protein n=1 Tax=Dorcoceras hygrometricum TaxID=472368 RepID=A0A2Z7AEN5_9LAMI|nr:hypothetical protein F511_01072 [Dorcoceras hygrometricum]
MAATRLLRLAKMPAGLGFSKETVSTSSFTLTRSRHRTPMCLKDIGSSSDTHTPNVGGCRKPVMVVQATSSSSSSSCVLISEPKMNKIVDLALLFANTAQVLSKWLAFITRRRPWRSHIQMFVEKVIIDCRFFALLAVAGSLMGSVLCCVQGCFLVLESYFQYFHAMSKMSEQGHVVLLLIEAIDMFLVGIAMLIFGMAMHIMFVGTNNSRRLEYSASTTSKNFSLEKLSSLIKMRSVMQAKSKIGHAVILILQVEILEKFKYVTTTSPLDLVCYAGVVLLSSASIFILSRIALSRAEG